MRETFAGAVYDDVLVGLETPDDAAVYRLRDDLALVVTVDFFTPIVDDPYAYGAIAAANSLSDVYAMGARPLLALNVAAMPSDLPPEIVSEILRGGAEKAREAGLIPEHLDTIAGTWGALYDTGDLTYLNLVHLLGYDGTDPDDLTRGEMEGRKQAMMAIESLKQYTPGCENAKLRNFGMTLGIRDTRKIDAAYNMTEADVRDQGRFEEAAGSYRSASAVRPEDFQTLTLLAKALRCLGKESEARSVHERELALADHRLELQPNDSRALSSRAIALVELGRIEAGIEAADTARTVGEPDAMLYYPACAYSRAGAVQRALDCMEEAVAAGWAHRDWLERDRDLDPLRDLVARQPPLEPGAHGLRRRARAGLELHDAQPRLAELLVGDPEDGAICDAPDADQGRKQ